MNKTYYGEYFIEEIGIFEQFRNKRIFITGGTGFFGKNLLLFFDFINQKFLLNCSVTVLSRNPESFFNKNNEFENMQNVEFVTGDIRDFVFPEKCFDYIIHAATDVDKETSSSDEIYSVIVNGTKRILEMCAKKKVTRLLYVSSGAVYGVQPPDLLNIPEDYPCSPVNAYGQGKLDAENLCSASKTDTVIARCFAFVGPYLPLDKHFAIGNFINNILNDEDINIKGDGSPYRSYMYAADLTEWLLTILLKGKTNEAYNVGSDKAISIADLAKVVCKYSSTGNTRVNIAQKAVDGILSSRYVPCIDKAKKELNLKCKISLEDAIQKTINWNKEKI